MPDSAIQSDGLVSNDESANLHASLFRRGNLPVALHLASVFGQPLVDDISNLMKWLLVSRKDCPVVHIDVNLRRPILLLPLLVNQVVERGQIEVCQSMTERISNRKTDRC